MGIMPPLYYDIPSNFDKKALEHALEATGHRATVAWGLGRNKIKVSCASAHRERLVSFLEGWLACLRSQH